MASSFDGTTTIFASTTTVDFGVSSTSDVASTSDAPLTSSAPSASSIAASTSSSITQSTLYTTFATSIRSSSSSPPQSSSTSGAGWTGGYQLNPSSGTDNGASGSSGANSFNLSKGGMIAIIVVCVFIIVLGVASTVLFVIAKRRQINIRQSIIRASRRLTGRFGDSKSAKQDNYTRRGGRQDSYTRRGGQQFGKSSYTVNATGPLTEKNNTKFDVKSVPRMADPLRGRAPVNTKPREQAWVKNLWGGSWKQ